MARKDRDNMRTVEYENLMRTVLYIFRVIIFEHTLLKETQWAES